jgi:hypothetical protein
VQGRPKEPVAGAPGPTLDTLGINWNGLSHRKTVGSLKYSKKFKCTEKWLEIKRSMGIMNGVCSFVLTLVSRAFHINRPLLSSVDFICL